MPCLPIDGIYVRSNTDLTGFTKIDSRKIYHFTIAHGDNSAHPTPHIMIDHGYNTSQTWLLIGYISS